jgi:uncharacterized membrane protein YtjA (UPF0391 family)
VVGLVEGTTGVFGSFMRPVVARTVPRRANTKSASVQLCLGWGFTRAAGLRPPRPHAQTPRKSRGTFFALSVFQKGTRVMLYWAAVFFVIALVAAVLGFSGIAAGAAGIAKILFFVFLVLGALSLIFGRRVPV